MTHLDVAGLKIDSLSKAELLDQISARLKSGNKTFLTTPYSEFLYRSLRDPKLLEVLNQADFAVPDGIGIFWAAKFLSIPLTSKSYYGKILQAWWQAKYCLWAILFYPKYIRQSFKEKISGSELIWDLTKLAAKENKKIFLLGGFGDTPKIVAEKLKALGANVVEWSNKNPDDATVIDDIKTSNPDFLFVAYGPIRQERWIVENMEKLPCKLYIGLGGTFDYIAQKQLNPPHFMRFIGLEWLFRLVTQPKRWKRIWQATFGLVMALIRYKVVISLPLRDNAVSIILNDKNQVLVCKRNTNAKFSSNGAEKKYTQEIHWQFPQGGMEHDERPEQTAIREAGEEVGLKNLELIKISPHINSYTWNNKQRRLFSDPRYSGQNQRIVYLKHIGADSEVKVDGDEFTDYQWVNIKDLNKIVHPQRLPVAEIVQQDLKDLA